MAAVSRVSDPSAVGREDVEDQQQRDDDDRDVDDVAEDRAERARALHEPHRRERRPLQRLRVVDVRLVLRAVDDAVHHAVDDEAQDPGDHQRADDDADDRQQIPPRVGEERADALPEFGVRDVDGLVGGGVVVSKGIIVTILMSGARASAE